MIRSFGDRRTEDLFHGRSSGRTRRIGATVQSAAVRKLDMLNAAISLGALRMPPGNRLEALSGNLQGFHSIRINEQWRIVFVWKDGGAEGVQIIDYHR